MFVQVITAPVGDAEAIERAMDRWDEERRPQAKGFLGATSIRAVFVLDVVALAAIAIAVVRSMGVTAAPAPATSIADHESRARVGRPHGEAGAALRRA